MYPRSLATLVLLPCDRLCPTPCSEFKEAAIGLVLKGQLKDDLVGSLFFVHSAPKFQEVK